MAERTWRIVTPEAVALDLESAGLASRVLAILIDLFALQMVAGAISTVFGLIGGTLGGDVLVTVVLLVTFFLLLLAWPIAWEVGTRGRSLGKMALGLRVVTVEGGPIRFRHALVRGLLFLVEGFFTLGSVALLVALGSRRFRRLGDHLAGTVVVRDRSGTPQTQAIRFLPLPGWEAFADGLDVSRLTPDHHRLVRSYLLRAPSLDGETTYRLGHQILDEIAAVINMAPQVRQSLYAHQPSVPLTAIAAAYQRRFSPDPPPPSWIPSMFAPR